MTTIRYFIPEDGDSELHPNVFLAPKSRHAPPTLGEIKHSFPLPGRYHFRFKSPLVPGGDSEKNAVAVWMDCVDDRHSIPTWRNNIVAKVTRVGIEDDDDDEDDDEEFERTRSHGTNSIHTTVSAASTAATPSQVHHRPTPAAEPMLDIFDGPSPAVTQTAPRPGAVRPPPPTGNVNLLDVTTPAPATSLLDMDGPVHGAPPSANDFLGMTATPHHHQAAPTYPGGFPQQQQPPQQQQQARPTPPHSGNAFDGFSNQQGPFSGLGNPW